jgi:hypothetical protein
MSTSVVAIPLAPVLGIAPPPPRSESYAPDEDSAERAAAANPPEMAHISGVRNRQPQSSRNDQGDSTTTSAPSTPTSSEEHEQTDGKKSDNSGYIIHCKLTSRL